MTINNNVTGILALVSPLYIAGTDGSGVTQTKPIMTAQGAFRSPIFPANDCRGRLRRKSASRFFKEWIAQGITITPALVNGMTCGVADGNPENMTTIEEVVRAHSNVYMGVFGGGTRMLRSGFVINDMDAITQLTVDAGIVPSKYAEPELGGYVPMEMWDGVARPIYDGYKLMYGTTSFRVDDIMRATNPDELANVITGGIDAVAEFQESIMNERAKTKANKAELEEAKMADKKATLKKEKRQRVENMMTYRAVMPGVLFYFRLDISDLLTDEQVGLLLLSWRDLLLENAFGGYARNGIGKVAVRNMQVTLKGQKIDLFADNGTMEFSPEVEKLAAAAMRAIKNTTPEEMELFFNHVAIEVE